MHVSKAIRTQWSLSWIKSAVDAMQAFEESSLTGRYVELRTTCAQPAALLQGLEKGVIG
ncbi:MAG: hypothetical protein ACFUZC_22385 [Chthoniobacteraceae bacterium]